MKVLVIGSGGREHALAWKIRQSPRVKDVYVIPGNAGTAGIARNVQLNTADLAKLRSFAREEGIDLTVVGPDDALAAGIVDAFQAAGLRIFGPSRKAAQLEASKSFAKRFMVRHGIPTARFAEFQSSADARCAIEEFGFPLVVKADGLALGKGVVIAANRSEAVATVDDMIERRRFGEAGRKIVLEEYLTGAECSIHALVDGSSYLLFPTAQDHKQIYDGNRGPNTGGMGTCSPSRKLDSASLSKIREQVLDPFIRGIQADGLDFRGLLFPGLMLTNQGPRVLEFNCRFGDPEAQVLLPRLKGDIVDLLEATIDGQLRMQNPEWDTRAAVCVVMASGGYPGSYKTGKTISGLEQVEKELGLRLFHAGTRRVGDQFVTAGGRVIGVTAMGATLLDARKAAYQAVEKIEFDGSYFRHDIGIV
jgi:phosphoribosylamine---glycine ligase